MNHLYLISKMFFHFSSNVPISVPTPSGDPPNAMSADSPPDEPPDVSFRLRGLRVRPNTLFTVSAIIIAVGTFVLT